ncbi:MAG: anthranilate synthase component I family protein [Salibacteraceae bacterium]
MKTYTIHTHSISTLADLLTPVGVYSTLRDRFPNALLLESADYHSRAESKSFICLEPMAGFSATGTNYQLQLQGESGEAHTVSNPREIWAAFSRFLELFEAAPSNQGPGGCGLFGYTAFEAVNYVEDLQLSHPRSDAKDNPDLHYHLYRYVLVFDHFKNELHLTENCLEVTTETSEGLQRLLELLPIHHPSGFGFQPKGEEQSSISDAAYREYVEKGIAHCQRGDVFQVVLSREFQQAFTGDDFLVYRSLRSINPSPYLFYFDYGDFRIFGSSPESQLQLHEGTATIHPIAGTVLRGADTAEDEARARALQNDPKEKAEHVMLVDLARNDLSKHAEKVAVETYAEIQQFSHVMHMVSKVSGSNLPPKSGLTVFADTFPAGTLSGAPKYRALQIIDACETSNRNFYGGAIGFFGFDGSVNHAIIIRSILSKNNVLTYQAGAGIVVASSPEGELQEVNNKVAALRRAIAKAATL